MTREDRARGALLGLAVGDALGAQVEFMAPGTFEPPRDMVGGGPHRLPPGAWTDDTSMAICLAESLLECRGNDPVDQLRRYLRWYRDGVNSSTGECFDIGIATRTTLTEFEREEQPYPGDAHPDAAGNGSLMRLAPVPLFFADDPARAIEEAAISSRTTHGARQAVDACRWFAWALLRELGADDAPEPTGLHPEVAAAIASTREPPQVTGGGYVVHTLEAVLWAVRGASGFEEAVTRAVDLGDDADTVGAIAGQLAGARWGFQGIPDRWLAPLHERDRVTALADALVAR